MEREASATSVAPDESAAAGGPTERALWMHALDALSVATLAALLSIAAARLAVAVAAGGAWALLVPAALVATLAADLVSGIVHWIGDRFLDETTPVVGALLIRPFREHHRDPLAITRHDFFELCGNNALAVVGPVLLLVLAGPPGTGGPAIAGHACVLFFAGAVFATNLFHKWAHAAQIGRPVVWLQTSGLILSPAAHARHHAGDFSRGYCVTTGWMNAPLDALRVLPRCEAAVRRLQRTLRRARRGGTRRGATCAASVPSSSSPRS